MEGTPIEDASENIIYVTDEDGNEVPLTLLASREDGDDEFMLVAEGEDVASYYKCMSSPDDEETVVLEFVGEDHEDWDRVLALFKDAYEEFEITFD